MNLPTAMKAAALQSVAVASFVISQVMQIPVLYGVEMLPWAGAGLAAALTIVSLDVLQGKRKLSRGELTATVVVSVFTSLLAGLFGSAWLRPVDTQDHHGVLAVAMAAGCASQWLLGTIVSAARKIGQTVPEMMVEWLRKRLGVNE